MDVLLVSTFQVLVLQNTPNLGFTCSCLQDMLQCQWLSEKFKVRSGLASML